MAASMPRSTRPHAVPLPGTSRPGLNALAWHRPLYRLRPDASSHGKPACHRTLLVVCLLARGIDATVGLVVGGPDLGQALLDRVLAVEQEVLRHLDALVRRALAVGQQQLDHLLVLAAAQDQADRVVLALGACRTCAPS